jgi:hypothetical protein
MTLHDNQAIRIAGRADGDGHIAELIDPDGERQLFVMGRSAEEAFFELTKAIQLKPHLVRKAP